MDIAAIFSFFLGLGIGTKLALALLLCATIVVVLHDLELAAQSRRIRRVVTEHLGRQPREKEIRDKRPLNRLANELREGGFIELNERFIEFMEATHHQQNSQHKQQLYNAYPASEYFETDRYREIIETKTFQMIPDTLVESAPAILTSCGILGTFFGILTGLANAQTNDPSMPIDLEQLLAGLAVSFTTSIAGLGLSILVTIVSRIVDAHADHTVNDLVLKLDSVVVRRTSQQVLEELLAQQEQATAAMQTLKTDLSEAIEHALNQAISEHLAPTFERMEAHTDEMKSATMQLADGAADRQLEGLGALVESLQAQVDTAVTGPMREAGQMLNSFVATQKSVTNTWAGASTQLEAATRVLQTQADSHADLQANSLRVLDEAKAAAQAMAESATRTARASKMVETGLQNLDGVASKQAETSKHTLEAAQKMRDGLESRLENWVRVSSEFKQLNEQLTHGMTSFASQFPEQLRSNLDIFDKELAQAVGHLSKSYSGLSEQVVEFNESVADAVDRLSETLGDRK